MAGRTTGSRILLVAVYIAVCMPARAHRLDEYLQATIITIERDRVQGEITLTPGLTVLPIVLAEIKRQPNGSVSDASQRAYASHVVRDLSLAIDGQPLSPEIVVTQFPGIQNLQEGLGEIKITFSADLPAGKRNRKLVFQNRHKSGIAAYQVNCLTPKDARIRVTAQNRNYSQSSYELDYTQSGINPESPFGKWTAIFSEPPAIFTSVLLGWIALVWTQRTGRNSASGKLRDHEVDSLPAAGKTD